MTDNEAIQNLRICRPCAEAFEEAWEPYLKKLNQDTDIARNEATFWRERYERLLHGDQRV